MSLFVMVVSGWIGAALAVLFLGSTPLNGVVGGLLTTAILLAVALLWPRFYVEFR